MSEISKRPTYEDSKVNVTYPDDRPVFDGASLTVQVMARVDSEAVVCAITAEALEVHFDAVSALESNLIAAFDKGRNRILWFARKHSRGTAENA